MPNCSMRPLRGSGFVAIHSHPPIATRREQNSLDAILGGFRCFRICNACMVTTVICRNVFPMVHGGWLEIHSRCLSGR